MRVRTLLNPFSCQRRYTKLLWNEIFKNFNGIIDVEIGFGTGSFIHHYAHMHEDRTIIGFEIRKRLVEIAQAKASELNLENTLLLWGNGQLGLEDMFDDNSIDRLFIFHPDPWPKRQHQRRRIINETFLALVHRKLKPEGKLYLATDVADLWDSMNKSIAMSQKFRSMSHDPFWATMYQTRWQQLSIEQKRSLFFGTFKKPCFC